jgi:hypothetical protein
VLKSSALYDLLSESDGGHINTAEKRSVIESVVTVHQPVEIAVKKAEEPVNIEPFIEKSAHEVFISLINASTCFNGNQEKKPEGFYIITPSSFYELC